MIALQKFSRSNDLTRPTKSQCYAYSHSTLCWAIPHAGTPLASASSTVNHVAGRQLEWFLAGEPPISRYSPLIRFQATGVVRLVRLSAPKEKNKSVRHPPGRKRSNPRNHRNHEYLPKWHNHRISAEPESQHLQLAAASGGQRLRPGPSSSHARILPPVVCVKVRRKNGFSLAV